jgi:ATP-dependent RNA/DNA helicase IGHMBP2
MTFLQGFGSTLFKKLTDLYGSTVSVMLDTQYRMHENIMGWSNAMFYEGKLQAHSSVATHTLHGLQVLS